MRPLNRPMFRNGGPIKEGIMSGMKTKAALVGDPVFPKAADGRAKHGFFAAIPFIGGLAARMGLSRAATAVAGQGAKKVAQKTLPSTTTPVSGTGGGFFRNIFTTQKPAPYSPVRIGQSKGAKELGMKPKVLGKPGTTVKDTVPKSDIATTTELKPYFASDPTIALVRGTYNALTNPQAKGLFAKGARFVLSPTGLITGGYFAGGKFFDGEGNEIPTDQAEDLGLTAGEKIDEKVF